MDKREIYDQFNQLREQTEQMLAAYQTLEEGMTALLQENVELEVQNQYLRDILRSQKESEDEAAASGDEPKLSKSRQNLDKLYAEGFHVCKDYFGQPRDKDDSCLFCIQAIFGPNKKEEEDVQN
ncbi:DNA replication initiation control protein YabA [Levilactobacillus bambusae]|uniref:DNA replication initiation control protein YabA n=1 Tax=Levilactobacillus bambusae TaxID=2024736 RepID=A0A2V1MZ18_9LACO|nr:DNA replication initiation control protein YabA [Levilactobacillus bambusae]PWF99395.1 DNA replication initiation control protein YabA [Levilactobacillus bambusae]